jgi:hypothetical protein
MLDTEWRITAAHAEMLVDPAEQFLAGEVKSVPQPLDRGSTYGLPGVGSALHLHCRLRCEDVTTATLTFSYEP